MSSIFGRSVIVPLTNKSGGGVIAGDVVILDSANNTSFTTTTSAGVTTPIGVAQETIASNATGRVLVEGYAALVNVNASVTRLHYGKTHTVAKQATDAGASRVSGTFCCFLSSGTTPDALIYPVDLAGAALTNPMSNQDDIIIGGAAGAPAQLVKGSAGARLAMGNGHVIWNAGSSFPGSKATNDTYRRTDILGGTDFTWDGTQWRSHVIRDTMIPPQAMPVSTDSTAIGRLPMWDTTWDLWVITFHVVTLVLTTNDGTNFWGIQLRKIDGAASATTLVTASTASDTIGTWVNHNVAVGASVAAATYKLFDANTVKHASPGNMFWALAVSYQIIAT